MVTIINYKQRQKEDGTTFYVLEVQLRIYYVQEVNGDFCFRFFWINKICQNKL